MHSWPVSLNYRDEPYGLLSLKHDVLATLTPEMLARSVLAPSVSYTEDGAAHVHSWAVIDGNQYAAGRMASQE